jgi:hypothetical protein
VIAWRAVGPSTNRFARAHARPNVLAVNVVGPSTVVGQVAVAVAGWGASSGHARLNTVPLIELACAVSPRGAESWDIGANA